MKRIEDYAIIGNFRTCALVSREGSVDWLCLPRFDSPACFAALLGDPDHGRWALRPRSFQKVTRRYRPDTLVLETRFESPEGEVLITDAMCGEAGVPTLVRIAKGIRGHVPMIMELVLRFDYGSVVPWVTRNPFGGIKAVAGPDTVRLRTTRHLFGRNFRTYSEFDLRPGETAPFVMTWTPSHDTPPPDVDDPWQIVERNASFWQDWTSKCNYQGPYAEAVRRSLITLKALTYHPTGGIVAAPTTSLPEQPGGPRNWDYRYCWLRDSTLTLYSLLHAGYTDEARRWRDWLLRAVAGTPSEVNIMYGLGGERRLNEMEVPWLPGFEDSRPVRIGNQAHRQLQLDVYGELIDTLHLARKAGLNHDERSWRMQVKLMDFLEEAWRKPDSGIWEVRSEPRHFTYSKVMAWVAFDRSIRAVEELGFEGDFAKWRRIAEEIRAEILDRGYDRHRGHFVQAYGSRELDASLLLLPLVGFLPAKDPRILRTVEAIQRELMHDGFVRRYRPERVDDGLPGGEGSFLACTLWLADNLTMQGRVDEAREIFERLLSIQNDVGLLAEEYDPAERRFLGNFPQAFSHIGLINTAYNLARAESGPAASRGGHAWMVA